MPVRDPLPAIVVGAIVALLVLVAVVPMVPAVSIGSLPLGLQTFRPSLEGTYYAPCRAGSLPIRWAAFLYQSDRPNTTFRLSGAWTASKPTYVAFGFSANLSSPAELANWILFAHCPLRPPNYTPPAPPSPPSLPVSGFVDETVTTYPGATLFLLVFRTFDAADAVEVTQPFLVTPV